MIEHIKLRMNRKTVFFISILIFVFISAHSHCFADNTYRDRNKNLTTSSDKKNLAGSTKGWFIGDEKNDQVRLREFQPMREEQHTNTRVTGPQHPTQKVTSTQSYIERGPITIASDFQLINSGFPGNGTIDDPIRIEGYYITTSTGSLISISDTRYYFTIKNNLLNGLNAATEGISFSNVKYGSIEKNIICNNKAYDGGIILEFSSSHNIIINNSIYNNSMGINIAGSNNTLVDNTIYGNEWQGIWLNIGSYNNTVAGNTIYGNSWSGIELEQSNSNFISNNFVYNNLHVGICIFGSNYNVITENLFWNDDARSLIIELDSHYNIVSFNDFTKNSIPFSPQAADNNLNSTNTFEYNYWNDWISPDFDSDGIVDDPYPIDSNQDLYPLTEIDLNLPHLVLAPRILSPKENEVLNGTVYINWMLSVDSHKHVISYNLSYSTDNGKNWIEIKSKLISHYYRWDTTTIPDGTNYLIRVVAHCEDGCSSSGGMGTLTIQNKVEGPDLLLTQIILASLLAVGSIALGYYLVNTKFRVPSFIEYFQSDKIEFQKPIYHKLIIGLESIQPGIMSEAVVTPLLEEPTTPTSLVTWFPDDYRRELKSKFKGRTILTLIEIAFQYSEDANLTKLAQALDIPASTLSDELKKLVKLNYLDFHVIPQVLHDGRFRHYIITAKGISFLKILKSALELSIRRAKEKEQFT